MRVPLGLEGSGFRGLGFRGLGFRVLGLGLLGFRVGGQRIWGVKAFNLLEFRLRNEIEDYDPAYLVFLGMWGLHVMKVWGLVIVGRFRECAGFRR